MYKSLAIAAVVILSASPAHAQGVNPPSTRWTDAALITANTFDLGSTIYALKVNHAREANPLMGNSLAGIVPLKIGGTIVNVYINHKLSINHPKLAKVTAWIISGALSGVAAHNLTTHGPKP